MNIFEIENKVSNKTDCIQTGPNTFVEGVPEF